MTDRVGRRSFLVTFGVAAGGLAASGAELVRRLQPWRVLVAVDPVSPATRLSGLLRTPASAAAVGEWYVHHVPDEATAARLAAAVLAALPDGDHALALPDGKLRAAVAERVQDEFATGDVLQLDGWIVSRTEARLCALCVVR